MRVRRVWTGCLDLVGAGECESALDFFTAWRRISHSYVSNAYHSMHIFNGHASTTLLHSNLTTSICVLSACFTVSVNHYFSVLDLPVALDQITCVTSKSRKHSLSSEVADGPASSAGLCSHQTELSMADAEGKESSECRVYERPELRLTTRVSLS
jgi:hypothetical protein